MSAPKTRKFTAWINLQPPGPFKLIVVGEVETSNGALQPVLTRREPQGIVPTTLLLDLTIEDTGQSGTADINYRAVRYQEGAKEGTYSQVDILWEDEILLSLPVGTAH